MKYLKIYERNGKTAKLTVTQKEGAGYRWVNCLALISLVDGSWLYSGSWRTNHFRKAEKEVKSLGWEERMER